MLLLTSENLESVFMDCLFKESELVDNEPTIPYTPTRGIINNYRFHTERLESHKQDVIDLLSQISLYPGGIFEISNICFNTKGQQWGEHANADQLIALATGLKLGQCYHFALGPVFFLKPTPLHKLLQV